MHEIYVYLTKYILELSCTYIFPQYKLLLHKNEVFFDYNLKIAHILCSNETHFNPSSSNLASFILTSQNIDAEACMDKMIP
jgi:hypothetical protein